MEPPPRSADNGPGVRGCGGRRHAAAAVKGYCRNPHTFHTCNTRTAGRELPGRRHAAAAAQELLPQHRHQDVHHGRRDRPAQRRQVVAHQLAQAGARRAGAGLEGLSWSRNQGLWCGRGA
eukprot:120436-Chlamydomonas_euryale.AAC.10